MNVLVVEDDAVIREGVAEFLREMGYCVLTAADGGEGLDLFRTRSVHLMILDVMLPVVDGLRLLREVRRESRVPVLMLTALSDEDTQLQSFDALADGYMTKPFSLAVLGKRVEALLRRSYGDRSVWTWGETVVDFSGCRATWAGQEVHVTAKELKLLELLLRHKGQVLTREHILNEIWGDVNAPYDRVIDVYVKNLRKKLRLSCIVTVKSVGYKVEL